MREECSPIIPTLELPAVASRPGIREFLFGAAFAHGVLGEEFFVDTPPEKGCDVVPVGIRRRASEFIAVDSFLEMTCVLAHVRDLQLVEILDGVLAIGEPGDPLFDSVPCIALVAPAVRAFLFRTNASSASSILSLAIVYCLPRLGCERPEALFSLKFIESLRGRAG